MNRYHLGFPVKVLGAPLRSHDSRRWQNQPHLSVSLAYLRDILEYLHRKEIHFYRLAGQLAPYITHPALPQFHKQIDECANELAAVGDLARRYDVRLSLHPAHYIQLGSPEPARVARSMQELEVASRLLDAMGLAQESVIVVHLGGAYGDRLAARTRFVESVGKLSAATRQRIAVENDDRLYSVEDGWWVYRRTGVRLVFDTLHHRCHNPSGLAAAEALALALSTWPQHLKPKVHFSSSRTAVRQIRQIRREGRVHIQAPLPNQHSDFIHPFEFIDFVRNARAAGLRPFDIMLEAKAKDLALLRLREQIGQFAPDLADEVV